MSATALAPTASVVLDFRHGGNSNAFAREGWRGCESGHRWSIGERNLLVLPPLARNRQFALTVDCDPPRPASVKQDLGLELNGVSLGVLPIRRGVPQRIILPGDIVSDAQDNTLVFVNPHLTPSRDKLAAALAWRRLELFPTATTLFNAPEPLAEPEDMAAVPMQDVLSLYQSLGQNCELGIFQRRYGAEPLGLLRFASIYPDRLVRGLRLRFEGIDAASDLSLAANRPGAELMGRHAIYDLSYHTFRKENEVDVEAFKVKELRRLSFLARLFFEQMENDEKIFVRRGDFETEGEFLALHQMLRAYNPEARLLLVQAAAPEQPERAAHVERLAPNLYRAFLSHFADPARVPTSLAYEDWLKICATLYLDQKARGRIEPEG